MKYLLLSLISFFIVGKAEAQYSQSPPTDFRKYTNYISEQRLESILTFLSSDSAGGRATGSYEMTTITAFLIDRLKSMSIKPLIDSTFVDSFYIDYYTIARNVVGILPAKLYSDKYIVVSAHYDHIGTLEGTIYNGADDNASGVTALLTIADMLARMRYDHVGPEHNIIFAFLDAKENNMSGSKHFLNNLPIPTEKILYEINIDQIGSTLSPPGNSENYILVLPDNDIKYEIRRRLDYVNTVYGLNMDIDHTFYGSPAFFDIFFKISDQYIFSQKKIPSMLFTSGITTHTYKQTDDHDLINYAVLADRIKLIFHLINNLSISPF